MAWSLSEFLNLVELRSQTWCRVDIGRSAGFRIPRSEGVLFYSALAGSARLSWGVGKSLALGAGETVFVLSGDAHSVRCPESHNVEVLTFLAEGQQVDAPVNVAIGPGAPSCELLCGRLKVRWPTAKRPRGLPPLLRIEASECLVDVAGTFAAARTSGGTSVLTKMATFLFINAFRADSSAVAIFQESRLREPISQAVKFIEIHPFTDWTVHRLAQKVGMGRSNFAMRFTADVGSTPMAFVTKQRMKHAAEFLERTDLKVAEIAERIGYRSESAFSRRFKEHFGMTPRALRERLRIRHGYALELGHDTLNQRPV